jgi:response regulator of citrate/malate metabolism
MKSKETPITTHTKKIEFLTSLMREHPSRANMFVDMLHEEVDELAHACTGYRKRKTNKTLKAVANKTGFAEITQALQKRLDQKKRKFAGALTNKRYEELYKALEANPTMTFKTEALKKNLSLSRSAFHNTINMLIEDGFVERVAEGQYKLKA